MTDINIITPSEFPEKLRQIPDPPKELYIRGELPKTAKYLTVVGSRKFTQYGRDVCEKLIAELSPYDVTIVSGLALGIDSIAHNAALRAGLKTVAFPGSGLNDDALYPQSHLKLAHTIIESGGALISEFKPDQISQKYMFPQRNRLVAGISDATLIIEAEEKSGTLITARLAMDYNRDVLTVPGSIYSSHSKGPHNLIKDGAIPITCGTDLLKALNIHETATNERLANLSEHEQLIVEHLASPLSKDDLIDSIDLDMTTINITLSTLEIKGLVQERLGKMHLL